MANFGGNLIVWDTVLGTRYLPPGTPEGIGFAGDEQYPQRWWGQVAAPFRARREQAPASDLPGEA